MNFTQLKQPMFIERIALHLMDSDTADQSFVVIDDKVIYEFKGSGTDISMDIATRLSDSLGVDIKNIRLTKEDMSKDENYDPSEYYECLYGDYQYSASYVINIAKKWGSPNFIRGYVSEDSADRKKDIGGYGDQLDIWGDSYNIEAEYSCTSGDNVSALVAQISHHPEVVWFDCITEDDIRDAMYQSGVFPNSESIGQEYLMKILIAEMLGKSGDLSAQILKTSIKQVVH